MAENSNYDVFIKEDFEKYKGKWVAICERNIVSVGGNAKDTFKKAQQKYPDKKVMIIRVPEEQTMIF